jgi:hypothetical protein
MSTQASDWYLYADTDLFDPENTIQFFKYWQAIKGEHIDHYLKHKELIPQYALIERLVREFPKYTAEQMHELFCTGYDTVYADEIAKDYEIENDEELKELTENLFEYIKLRIEQDRHEKAVLKALEEEL